MRRGFKRKKELSSAYRVWIVVALLCIIAASAVFYVYIVKIRPLLEEYSLIAARNQISLMINRVVENEIAESELAYNALIHIEKDDGGQISSLSSDVSNMNKLKVSIENRIIEEILNHDELSVSIPVGTLMGNELFSGRGPHINIRVVPMAQVYAYYDNKFESAGINQTRHSIFLNYDTKIKIMLPGKETHNIISSSVCVAETIVVGMVPHLFSGTQK